MEDSFRKHVDSLLKIGAIRPSKSRHRTMAMIVNSGTTIDPATGREVKGKERMVFNYKSLNDNTYKDQYSLPGINTIIKRIGGAKIFLKFDLKSGFHQVAMDEESIPWTAFLVPRGLYEWLVMPFGLKNAPAVFQRKMDKCFKGTESFIAVYIDDILVFSKNEKDHAKHLERMLNICEDNGLVLSLTKMKIAVSTVDFLGAVIGEGTIKLQPHIIKKIINFNEEELKTKKGLRMHRRNEGISSSNSLLSGGSSTVPQCLSEEYEDYLRRSHEDFQPLPRIFIKTIFTPEEPGALYKRYQLKANQTPIRIDKSDAWRSVAQDLELLAAKEAVKAMRNLQAIIQCKAQI
ncbi:retrotransposon protein, putative, ty3-gypsy subclass [Tanacetum coccineum]